MDLTDKNYKQLIEESQKPIFIDFYSPSCGPCQALLSIFDKLKEHGIKHNVLVYKCNIAENPKIASKYMIRSVPLTLCINIDKKIIHPEVGLKDVGYYFNLIEKISIKDSFFPLLRGGLLRRSSLLSACRQKIIKLFNIDKKVFICVE